MFATPGRGQVIDKENVGLEQAKTPGKSFLPVLSPARKPLSRLNQDPTPSQHRKTAGKVLQKIWTPQEDGTPSRVTPARKTPGRRSKNIRKSRGPSVASSSSSSGKRTAVSVTEAAESVLNEVLLREVTALSHHSRTGSGFGSTGFTPAPADGEDQLSQVVEWLVEDAIHAALQELRDEQTPGATPPESISNEALAVVMDTPASERLWSIALGLEDSLDSSALLLPQSDTSVFLEENGNSPSGKATAVGADTLMGATPTEETSSSSFTLASRTSRGTRPIARNHRDYVSTAVDTADSRPVNVLPGSTPTTSHQTSQGTTTTKPVGQEQETMRVSSVELEASMQVIPLEMASTSSGSMSIEIAYMSQGTTAVHVSDTLGNTTDDFYKAIAVSSHDVTSPVKPIDMKDSSMSVPPANSTASPTTTTPPTSVSKTPVSKTGGHIMPTSINVEDSPSVTINVEDSPSMTTPIYLSDAICGTTPVRVADTSTATTPISVTDTSSTTTPFKPVEVLNKSVEMTPIILTDEALGTSPVHFTDAKLGTTPIRLTDCSTATTPTCSVDAGIGTTPIKPTEVRNESVMMTPVKLTDAALGTSPVISADANLGTTPVRLTDTSTATTPTHVIDANIGTTPTKPVEMLNRSVMMTPIKMTDSALGTSPVKSANANIGTTPLKSVEIGLRTDLAETTDSCTGTTPVRVSEIAVGTGPLETADAQCGVTPVRLVDARCGKTPFRLTETGTAITPVAVSAAEVLTSPIVVPAFKLEAESPSQLDPACLMSHMESACISNELLRREIDALKTTQAELHSQLDEARGQLDQREGAQREEWLDQRVEVRQTAKESLQTEVDNLLLQVGEQMNQLGLLQGALEQKSAELVVAQQEKACLMDQYQKEIRNLQQDLRTAYKQHQQEVSDLHAFYEQNNYEPHYRRAMATVTELRTELQAYTDLKDTLDKAAEIQAQFGCMEEAYSLVNALFTRTMEKKDELELQHRDIVDQMSKTNAANELLQCQLSAAEEQHDILQVKLGDAVAAENEALKCQGQLLRDFDEVSQALEEAKTELHSTKLELFGFKDDYQTLKTKYDDQQKQSVGHFLAESSLEAALAVQGKQWQEATAELEALRFKSGEEIENLKEENARLSTEATDLKHQLSRGEDLISSLQSELKSTEETLRQQEMAVESLKAELGKHREARADAQRLARQLQSLRQQFKENTDFLEEERVALVEAAREAEDQVKVTSLELSRLKVALSQAEDAGSQWKGAAENLSEKLQFCQSELDNTKAHAHWLLLNQAAEMRDAAGGLTSLLKKMQNIHAYLSTRTEDQGVKQEKQEMRDRKQTHETRVPPSTQAKLSTKHEAFGSSSLVVSILSAVHSKDKDTNDRDDHDPSHQPKESPSTSAQQQARAPSPSESRLTVGGSGSSAFTTVQASTNQSSHTTEEESSSGASQLSEEKEIRDDSMLLVDQVEQARALLGQLLQLLLSQNEALESSVQDLKDERAQLNNQLFKAQKQHDHASCLLREQLRDSEMQERRLQQEVSSGKMSLAEQQEALQYAQQRLQAMADNLERFSDQKSAIEKLQTETAKLTSSLRVAQREKGLLQEQLDAILSGSSQPSSKGTDNTSLPPQQTAVNSKLVRENLSLKKDLEKLRLRLVERQEHYEALNARATRHVRVLEDNWKKADAEVYRLDELFDHCKQLMEQVPAASDEHSNMTALRELLS